MPSFTLILSCVFMAYVGHSVYTFAKIFRAPECTKEPCFSSFLDESPHLQLALFTSHKANPISSEVHLVESIAEFDYSKEFVKTFQVPISSHTRRNGSMHLHVIVAEAGGPHLTWATMKRDGPTVVQRISLTEYSLPKDTLFNLIGDTPSAATPSTKSSSSSVNPVTHFKPKIYFSLLTDIFQVGPHDIPPELANLFRVNKDSKFMPILQNDFLQTRLADLEQVKQDSETMPLTVTYKPMSIGKLRLLLHMQHAMLALKRMGFSTKDLDDIKGAFSDTNLYLLCLTVIVSSVHLLFDFLSFKNDIAFWRSKETYAGLSLRTTLWRGFSHIIIFLYLLDSNTSMLVQVPAGIGTLIELWKCKKILKMRIGWKGISFARDTSETAASEQLTKDIDRQGMKYLMYLLYPMCIVGAVYSLIYQPHKSWYSWTINSLVNGVYAFGFLFMLPQLFINYKLKSVAALPWRSFMYKAFNTFIDDIFAFIITMPTAHRLACFRDDIVFLIYLYQRYLYPVDKSRVDDGTAIEKTVAAADNAVEEQKKDK